ncbi:MAG TPA: type II 3-dehydroquinate dehydratase [Niabella sp.]|nr:type II 3-dehydroquinate dehydratase [Niabella sp.]HOZ95628.1 type II 3-dehydroquinate dehydratase [Niabella sp.]HQW13868.1 type II 3-dehydroquinate dehydratase [Niabella sp.]HQX19239.1 type II 3-dehydroquinate dehydratase [Niabella sp.]HQX41042.1 type II 3-dehydroquinate dehydratase [Niabella sp.]
MKIAIINGPNLNLLGQREPGIYGSDSFESFFEKLTKKYREVSFEYFQSNVEGELVNALQKYAIEADGIIMNPAAYTHTSVAIGDCIAAIHVPVVEVHISNVHAREEFRKLSHVSAKAAGTICGLGLEGYRLAVEYFIARLTSPQPSPKERG